MADSPSLQGQHILIASGPTRAPIDAVRYIGNRSTGRLGSAIGTELLRRGAKVTFVYGTGSLVPGETSPNLVLEEIETIDEAEDFLIRHLREREVFAVIMALAGLDYRPKEVSTDKLSSEPEERTITLVKCRKIIDQVKTVSPSTLLVGFKLEAGISEEELFSRADDLARRAQCDLVVANRTEDIDRDRHRVWIRRADRHIIGPLETPGEIAAALVDELARLGCE
ncbi:MAG: phosphopantothenoylcysteine decarboxylase [bacterium]